MTDRRRAKRLFLGARELPPEERQVWLTRECAGDADLQREVESLLAADDDMPSGYLERREVCSGPSLESGSYLSHFRIVELIGAGGMGEVYWAHDEELHRDVAIKVLPAFAAGDEAARIRLRREARAAAALNHANICTLHGVDEVDGRIYLVLERLEGRTLDAIIPERGLSLDQVLRYGIQIADALAHAHERGVVHCDLKPGNVVVTTEGRAKLLDFGIARRSIVTRSDDTPSPSGSGAAEHSALRGTPTYMAPEQLRGEPVDARCDIWQLGLLLYEMASGERPFQGSTVDGLSTAILEAAPRPLPARVPEGFRLLVERCLEKEPARRYPRARDVLSELERLEVQSKHRSGDSRGVASLSRWLPVGVLVVVVAIVPGMLREIGRPGSDRGAGDFEHAPIEAVAVLPFSSSTPGARDELLELGLADTLIDRLSTASELRVQSLASARRFADPDRDPREAGRLLDAAYVVDGSTQREGDRVRVDVRLVDVSDGTTLWADTFEESVDRVFELQDGILAGLAAALETETAGREDRSPCEGDDEEAYRAFLTGRYQLGRLDPERLREAQAAYRRAIDRDPSCARAYAGLSWTYRVLSLTGDREPTELLALARAAAEMAIEIDPASAEGFAQLGFVELWYDWDWEAAESSFRRATALNPSLAEAHLGYAHLEAFFGRFDAAEDRAHQFRQLDPLSPLINSLSAGILGAAGRAEAADQALELALELAPDFWHPLFVRGGMALDRGDVAAAVSDLERAVEGSGGTSLVAAVLCTARASAGDALGARAVLAELESRAATEYVPPTSLAAAHLGMGQREAALDLLERAWDERDMRLAWLSVDARWNPLRGEPRFQLLSARIGLPNQSARGRF